MNLAVRLVLLALWNSSVSRERSGAKKTVTIWGFLFQKAQAPKTIRKQDNLLLKSKRRLINNAMLFAI